MRKRFINIALALVLIFAGCEKIIVIDTLNIPQKLVLNAANHPDDFWKVHLSTSTNLTDLKEDFYDEAIVLLKDETLNNSDTLSYTADGYYISNNLQPQQGNTFSIEIQREGFDTISSTSYVPLIPNDLTISDSSGSHFNRPVQIVKVNFTDMDEIVPNYYLISVEVNDDLGDGTSYRFNPQLYTLDENTENRDLGDAASSFNHIYLPDTNFNGEAYSTDVLVDMQEFQSDTFCLTLKIQSVSEGLYLHTKSYQRYIDANFDALFNVPQQTPVYGNITNGYGIFGAYTEVTAEYCLP